MSEPTAQYYRECIARIRERLADPNLSIDRRVSWEGDLKIRQRQLAELEPDFAANMNGGAPAQPAARGPLPLAEIATANATDDPDVLSAVRRELVRRRGRELAHELTTPLDLEPIGCMLATMPDVERPPARAEGLLDAGGRLVLVAHRKAGKTHWVLNFARGAIKGERFLGRFEVTPVVGNVAWLNYELSDHQAKAWATEVGIPPDRLYIANLRGRPNPFATDKGRARLVAELVDHRAAMLLVDPWARAFHGDQLNDTSQAIRWCSMVDEVAHESGVSEIVVANHTGHDTTRGRNSTVLEDWADTIGYLTKDEQERRYFKATGRDIDIAEDRLDYDPISRMLTLTGDGSRTQARTADRIEELVDALVDAVAKREGQTVGQLERQLRDDGAVRFQNGEVGRASRRGEELGRIRIAEGPRRSRLHYLPTTPDYPRLVPPGPVT